jgi:hypothetical protein
MRVPHARTVLAGCVTVVALGTASFAVAHADVPCKQWRFDGYTEFDYSDGGKFAFIYWGPNIPFNQPTLVRAIPPNGGPVVISQVNGYIDGNNHLEMYTSRLVFIGGVTDDGFAYGIAATTSGDQSGSWRSAAPLRCADNGG